jgi:1,2-phenylacetyl-CoA epoxidase catalytic subunit
MAPAQRWIREAFNELREAGLSVPEAQESLGFLYLG